MKATKRSKYLLDMAQHHEQLFASSQSLSRRYAPPSRRHKHLVLAHRRTDLLRQHQYYDSGTLHYNNKAFADKISDRKPLVELRRKLKEFDQEV